jgi:hypothetical protein
MTLPYPYEVEIGRLKARPRFERAPFDVERHMRQAIRSSGEMVELFGVEYPLAEPWDGPSLDQLRSELTAHFEERVSTPDDEIWRLFTEQARAQLERHAHLDGDVLHMLRATIDGL